MLLLDGEPESRASQFHPFQDPPKEGRRVDGFRLQPLRGIRDLRPPFVRGAEEHDPAVPEQGVHLPEKHEGHTDIVQQIEGSNKVKRAGRERRVERVPHEKQDVLRRVERSLDAPERRAEFPSFNTQLPPPPESRRDGHLFEVEIDPHDQAAETGQFEREPADGTSELQGTQVRFPASGRAIPTIFSQ